MKHFHPFVVLAFFTIAAGSFPAHGQAVFHLISYNHQEDSLLGLVEGTPGVFYSGLASTVAPGGIISVTAQGQEVVLASLPSNEIILPGVVSGSNGRFYGSFEQRGTPNSNVFSVTSAGDAQVYSNQSIAPILTQNLPDGSILGLGPNGDVVFSVIKVGLDGTVASIYQFPSTDYPTNVILANDGNYYGIFYDTNLANVYAFRVTPSGSMTTLLQFPFTNLTGGYPYAPLLQGTDGNLYGAIYSGGPNGAGVIYKLTLSGQYTMLYAFPKGFDNPTSLLQASDGNLYGSTLGENTYSKLFRITTSGEYTTLYAMNPRQDGGCTCYLTQGSDGVIYGAAAIDGLNIYETGSFFALDAGLPKPQPSAAYFTPQAGPAGTRVRIWGNYLLSASVSFNGTPGTDVAGSGPNYVWATVPAGASSGPITVTTPGGTVTTTTSFTVQ